MFVNVSVFLKTASWVACVSIFTVSVYKCSEVSRLKQQILDTENGLYIYFSEQAIYKLKIIQKDS